MTRKHSKNSKLFTLLLALLLAVSAATPASALSWYQRSQTCAMSWQPKMNIIKASELPANTTTGTTNNAASNTTTGTTNNTASNTATNTTTGTTANTTTNTTTSGASAASSLEQQVVTLVNRQRAAYGLKALTLSAKLSDGARLKAQDMQKNHYFDHNSPTYGSPFDMMRSLGISYGSAGENIAMGYSSAEAVVNAWMNSPGHRANILNASFTQIGVGYVSNGGYWAQWFTN